MDNSLSNVSHETFYLVGFSDLQEYRRLLFLPFLIIFIFTVTSNAIMMTVIATNRKLHAPMYMLILAISLLGFFVPFIFCPRMLIGFLFDMNAITRQECLIQLFCMHYCGCFQSSILLGMAIDRCVAICFPLHYNNYVNLRNSLIFIFILVLRNSVIMLTQLGFLGAKTFCKSNVLYHCFCEQTLIVNRACGDISRSRLVALVSFFVPTTDCVIIVCSYFVIFVIIFRTPSGESRQKAIHTCSTHLICLSVAYVSVLVVFIGYRVTAIPRDVRVLTSLGYILLPNMSNPVIYGIRTKEIRIHIVKYFKCNKVDASFN